MKGLPEERAVTLGQYILEQNATVRQAASVFDISKSTVHKDVTQRLQRVNPNLHQQVKQVLDKNKQERHIRGGMATRCKYDSLRRVREQCGQRAEEPFPFGPGLEGGRGPWPGLPEG